MIAIARLPLTYTPLGAIPDPDRSWHIYARVSRGCLTCENNKPGYREAAERVWEGQAYPACQRDQVAASLLRSA